MLFTSFYDVNGMHLYSSPEDAYVHVIAGDERFIPALSSGLINTCLNTALLTTITPEQGYAHTSLLPAAPFLSGSQSSPLVARVWVDAITGSDDWQLFGALAERNVSHALGLVGAQGHQRRG